MTSRRSAIGPLLGAAFAGALLVSVSACSSQSEVAVPSASAASSTASAASAPAVAQQTTGDPVALVTFMWNALTPESQKKFCAVYAANGDKVGALFVEGMGPKPQGATLTDADKASIAAAGADLLKKNC